MNTQTGGIKRSIGNLDRLSSSVRNLPEIKTKKMNLTILDRMSD